MMYTHMVHIHMMHTPHTPLTHDAYTPTPTHIHRPRLLSSLSPVVVSKFLHALERAWLPVLDASSWKIMTLQGMMGGWDVVVYNGMCVMG